MTLNEFVVKLTETVQKSPTVAQNAIMVYTVPGDPIMRPAKLTLTYRSARRRGTTYYDQVPVVLIECEDQDE